jgi:hypothetical protein
MNQIYTLRSQGLFCQLTKNPETNEVVRVVWVVETTDRRAAVLSEADPAAAANDTRRAMICTF